MIQRGAGKIIFTASLLTFQGGITVPAYAASKGGIGSLVRALSNEWASLGVQVNGLAPGYIATDNTQALTRQRVSQSGDLEPDPDGAVGRARGHGRARRLSGLVGLRLCEWGDPRGGRRLDGSLTPT